MNKRLFLSELGQRLEDIPYREAMRVLNYYEEAIDDRVEDGMSEEEAVLAMGDIDDIAREILGEGEADETAGQPEEPAKTMAETVMETEKERGSNPFFSFEYDSDKKRGTYRTGSQNGERTARTYEAGEISGIRISELSGDVDITDSPDDRIHVESEDWRGLSCELQPDGTLAIARRRVRKNGKFLGISFDFDYAPTGVVWVLLPKGYDGPLAITSLSGDIEIECSDVADLKIKTTSGDVDVEAVTVAEQTVIATTSGDLELSGLVTGALDIATVSGDVELSGCAAAGKASVISTSGDLDLAIGSVVSDGHFETVSGDLTVSLGGSEDCYAIRIKDGASPEVVYGDPNGNPLVIRSLSGDIELSFLN